MDHEKICENCKNKFITTYFKTKHCGYNCDEIAKNKRINENWINKKPRERANNQIIEYARISKNTARVNHFCKGFNAYRG